MHDDDDVLSAHGTAHTPEGILTTRGELQHLELVKRSGLLQVRKCTHPCTDTVEEEGQPLKEPQQRGKKKKDIQQPGPRGGRNEDVIQHGRKGKYTSRGMTRIPQVRRREKQKQNQAQILLYIVCVSILLLLLVRLATREREITRVYILITRLVV